MNLSSSVIAVLLTGSLTAAIPDSLQVDRILDFEGTPAMASTQYEFRVSAPAGVWVYPQKPDAGSILSSNGTTAIYTLSGGGPLTLTHLDGTEFQLFQMDVAEYSTVTTTSLVQFAGWKADGTEIDFSFQLDGVTDGAAGPKEDFQTVVFPPGWTGLTRVELRGDLLAFDNIHVRGMKVENIGSSIASNGRLSTPALIAENATYAPWSVVSKIDANHLVLSNHDPAKEVDSLCNFNLSSGRVEASYPISVSSGADPEKGEIATVSNGVLNLTSASGKKTMARIGQDTVTAIAYPAVSNGKVAFINHFYSGETYAVFLADSTGVKPIVKPDTILSDGDTPYSFPYELFFRQNTLAFKTSTLTSGDCYLVSFNQGSPRLTPGTNSPLPGSDARISTVGDLLWLDDQSIGYVVTAGSDASGPAGSYSTHGVVVMYADGRIEGYLIYPNLAQTVIPGAGCVERIIGIGGFDRTRKIAYSRGTVESFDLGPNNQLGFVSHEEKDGSVLIREGDAIPSFGTIFSLSPTTLIDGDTFYTTCLNSEGQILVLRGTVPITPSTSTVSLASFAPTTDGTVRLWVNHLTHGKTYRIEHSDSPGGPWQESSRFSAGSQSRTVLGAMSHQSRDFFRLSEE